MNNINNLLNIGKNTIQEKIQLSNANNKLSFNSSFEDLLIKNNPQKPFIKQSISSKANNVSVYTISDTSLSKYGKKVISALNKFLSTENNKDTVKNTLKKINSILNKSSTSNALQTQELLNEDINIEDINLSDIVSVEDFDNSTLESMQAILTLLNQQQYNSANIEVELNESFVEASDMAVNDLLSDEDTVNSTDDLFNAINSIENTVVEIFNENSLSANSEVTDDFMQKLMLLVQNDNEMSSAPHFSKKEDMLEISNNLNISSVFTTNVNAIDISENIISAEMHPITKQVLSSIQAQLSAVNLDNKTVELRLKLFPSKLGAISVTLEHDSDGLRITLQSDNPDVRSILSESINDLKNNLNKFANEVFIDVSSNKENNNKEQNNRNINSIENINNYIEEDLVRINSDINLINKILDIKV